jgi:Protein of unknown function (DUF2892)
MTSNVGSMDRAIRFVLGVILIALGLSHILTSGMAIAAYCVGGIALLTGAIRFCPAWTLFGIHTCPLKAKESR